MAGKVGEAVISPEVTPCTWEFMNVHANWWDWFANPVTGLHWIVPHAGAVAMATALEREHVDGSTEPWIQDIVVALLHGLQRVNPVVLECGGFMGHTSECLAYALEAQGGGLLTIAEYDPEAPERADAVDARLAQLPIPRVGWRVVRADAIAVINSFADESLDFCYLDDDHSHEHVDQEIAALWPKMRSGGLITGHDVVGSCDLQVEFKKYGGIGLALPRLGPAGGIGILQVP